MSKESAKLALASLTDEEADLLNNSPELLDKFRAKHELNQPQPSLIKRGWDALQIPEQVATKATAGAKMAVAVIPESYTGNRLRDIALNMPKKLAETVTDFSSKVLPSLVSRPSIVTAGVLEGLGAAAPALRAVGRGIGQGAESISGLEYKTPGVLREAFNNPKLIFSPGKAKAEYEAAKEMGGTVRESLKAIPEKMKVVKESLKLAEKGKLNPTEALEARKELSALKKQVTGEFFRTATAKFNEVAKPVFEEADAAYRQGIKADALRMPLPVNKLGGTSIAKSTLGTIAGVLPLGAMSPIVQGGTASALGAGAKAVAPLLKNPVISGAALTLTIEKAKEFLKLAKGNRDKARKMAQDKGYVIPEVGQ